MSTFIPMNYGRLIFDGYSIPLSYLTSIVSAVGLQLCLVLMLLHGIKTERRSYLLPFIIFATLAAVMAMVSVSERDYGSEGGGIR